MQQCSSTISPHCCAFMGGLVLGATKLPGQMVGCLLDPWAASIPDTHREPTDTFCMLPNPWQTTPSPSVQHNQSVATIRFASQDGQARAGDPRPRPGPQSGRPPGAGGPRPHSPQGSQQIYASTGPVAKRPRYCGPGTLAVVQVKCPGCHPCSEHLWGTEGPVHNAMEEPVCAQQQRT